MKNITTFDKKCLEEAIKIAIKTFKNGNYPVGAVLAINEEIIWIWGNEINKQKSYVNHAENSLIIKYWQILAEVRNKKDKIVSLYTTLEPCIQCLGASVTNHIDRIIFIELDPNGWAWNIKHENIWIWYKEFWPELIQFKKSDEVINLMVDFFKKEIKKWNTEWPEKMLKLYWKI